VQRAERTAATAQHETAQLRADNGTVHAWGRVTCAAL
jgi:hypothetical protein